LAEEERGWGMKEKQFFAEIAALLQAGRQAAYKSVNTVMVSTYWKVGQRIVEQEQQGKARANYGDALIEGLSRYLGDKFGKGFSEANLWNMRQFYVTFPEFPRQCLENLGWSQACLIMRLENTKERDYYLQETSQQNWTVRTLERNIKTGYYRRILANQKSDTQKENSQDLATTNPSAVLQSFIKDPYVLEFLDVPEDLKGKESVLEAALVAHLQKFLLELGKGFSFIGRQQRISTEDEHYYIDLVFYNYLLKCFVLIDLKTNKLTHQDIGQMDMYVRMFDNLKRGKDDNPTIGIVFCTHKSEAIAKYSILSENKQIFAAKYKTVLPTEEELEEWLAQENRKLLGGGT
jgi:predicted nuclease of restriction endonuclease-like (RecB) superfamily